MSGQRREYLYYSASLLCGRPPLARISSLCGGFSGLLWGLLKELSRVKLVLREGGAGLGNVLLGTASS